MSAIPSAMQRPGWPMIVAALGIGAVLSGSVRAQATKPVDFAHDLVPVIKIRCAQCHTNGTYKGSFSLDTRDAMLQSTAVVPGKSAESDIIERITSDDPDLRMPPKGDRLTAKQVEMFRTWIDQGADWEPGYSFKDSNYVPPLKPRRVELPPAREGRTHPIDRILDAYHGKQGIEASPAVDDTAFLRRASLDLVGLLPTPEEREAFAADTAPGRHERVVRRLLDDRRAYADHWLSFWNDLLRNDYRGTGYIDGGRKQISGWLYEALVSNKPFDRFLRELISPSPESEGFINGIKWRGRVNASQVREIQFSQNVSQVFFGINMKCASCHDSFIDTWKLDDAYGLAAVIADEPLEVARCDKPTGRKAEPKFLFPELGEIDPGLPKEKRLERLAELLTHPDNGRVPRTIANRIWQRMMGRGIVHPVDVLANRPWSDDLLDYLGTYLTDHGHDLKELIAHIASSETYRGQLAPQADENQGETYVFRGPEVKRMTAEQFLDAIWMITGTAPEKVEAPVKVEVAAAGPVERQFVRAALINSDALMRSLGRPNREQVVTTRGDQLTTLQALDLSNGQILTELLARGAENLLKAEPNATPEQFVEKLYTRALGRKPTPVELATATQVVGSTATTESLADLLWIVFMLPEFQLIR